MRVKIKKNPSAQMWIALFSDSSYAVSYSFCDIVKLALDYIKQSYIASTIRDGETITFGPALPVVSD